MKFNIQELEKYKKNNLLISQKHPGLPIIIWNYSPKVQYEKLWDEITLKCRGLVTDLEGNVVAKTFDKFFNIEEEKELPSESFEVYEKIDGSLIIVFWYLDELVVASRGSFVSEQAKSAFSIFKKYDTSCLDKTKTYCFELIAPWNRIVCDYGDIEDLIFLAKFDNSGFEYPLEDCVGFKFAKKQNINNLNDIKSFIKNNEEGFVVKFESGKRLKVKGEDYVRLHKIVTKLSEKAVLENLISNNKDYYDKIPDEFYLWVKNVERKFAEEYNKILLECKSVYKVLPTRKETAIYFLEQKNSDVLFAMLDNKDYEYLIWKKIKNELLKKI